MRVQDCRWMWFILLGLAVSVHANAGDSTQRRASRSSRRSSPPGSTDKFTAPVAQRDALIVVQPNGRENVSLGQTMTIRWQSINLPPSLWVELRLYRSGLFITTINAATPNDGNYDWVVPSTLSTGRDFQVEVRLLKHTELSDRSDRGFYISVPRNGPTPVPTPAGGHASITSYAGPQTCLACHETEARQVHGSSHYQWKGATPNVSNINHIDAGKGYLAFNTYCGSPMTSPQYTCVACHVGNGGIPSPVANRAQLANIDCLVCHQDQYQRKFAPPYQYRSFTDVNGTSHTWKFPLEDAQGNIQFMPDASKMSITAVEAARQVHLPTRQSCLRCHATAAGSDGAKRGDLSSVSANPTTKQDVHLSAQGANLSCQACHTTTEHRIAGRGLDLLENDRADRLACSKCHGTAPHGSSQLNRHTERVACQTCHIPTYGKDMPTETVRNWRTPVWSAGGFSGQGSYKPEETKAGNLVPSYGWFDGTSQNYILSGVAQKNAAGQYEFARPNGAVNTDGAMIYPLKEHLSASARHTASGEMIPHATFTFFATGDINRAVAEGQTLSGLEGPWTWETVHTYQTINHGVEPKDNALACATCHQSKTRMDLTGKLGYALKGARSTICTQCHKTPEESLSFSELHSKHVTSKKYDCSWCHGFSRPSRGLRMPPATDYKPVSQTLAVNAKH